MAKDLMGYDKLVNDALRGVMIRALARVATKGLPGDHHFYIGFRTDAPGVVLSEDLRAQYPEELTVILQHQFWDLEVDDDAFSVTLTFNKVAERLTVPFAAVTTFADPGVEFGLKFQAPGERERETAARKASPAKARAQAKGKRPARRAETEKGGQVIALDSFRKK